MHDDDTMRLEEPRQLYGRGEELREMNSFLLSSIVAPGAKTRSCVVRGRAGQGKTALCDNLSKASLFCQQTANCNDASCPGSTAAQHQSGHTGYFLRGKLEQPFANRRHQSALLLALESLARQIRPEDEEDIQECLTSYEASIICRCCPEFARLFQQHSSRPGFARRLSKQGTYPEDEDRTYQSAGEGTSSSRSSHLNRTSERLAVALRALLRGFCRPYRPVCLFMDDIQWLWSDRESRETLSALLKDSQIENFCFLGAHRDEPEDDHDDHNHTFLLDVLLGQSNVESLQHLELRLDNLSLQSINAIASNMLHSDLERTHSLAQVVFQKTAGNPFFVIQFCQSLKNKGLLKFNRYAANGQWEWDHDAIVSETNVTDNVVDVVRTRIQSLDPTVGWILTLAAYLGYSFDQQVLRSLCHCRSLLEVLESSTGTYLSEQQIDDNRFGMALERAFQEGLVESSGYQQDPNASLLSKFTHDRIRQSMYELVPTAEKRDEMHHLIGQHVYDNYCRNSEGRTKDADSKWLLLAADQLNRGSPATRIKQEDCLFIIQLNHDAALAAKNKAGISVVADLLAKAIALTKAGDYYWETQYHLLLEIYSWSAEVEFARGNFEACQEIIATVQKRAKNQEDSVRALIVNMEMYGAQREFHQAIKEARKITTILGERLPSSSTFNIVVHLLKINRKVRNKPDSYFLELKDTTIPKYRYLIDVLYKASTFGWSVDPNFTGLCLLQMMKISLSHGVSEHTGYCYAGYGFVLGATGDPKGAFRFAKLGLEASRGKPAFLATTLSVYTSLYHFYEPASLWLEPMLEAYRIGLATGGMFYGSLCLSCHTCLQVFCGLPLPQLVKDARKFGGELKVCHQDFALGYVMAQYQFALNLTGESDDPLDCTRGALKKHDFFSENLLLDSDDAFVVTLDYFQVFNAYLLDDLPRAEMTLQRIMSRKMRRLSGSHFFNYFFMLVDVVAGSAIWRRESKRAFRKLVRNATNELKGLAKMGIMNGDGILSLAEAQMAEIQGKRNEEVKALYDTAISKLTRNDFVHFVGIASELACERMLRVKDQYWYEHYASHALECYEEWGATAKVRLMRDKHAMLQAGGG